MLSKGKTENDVRTLKAILISMLKKSNATISF